MKDLLREEDGMTLFFSILMDGKINQTTLELLIQSGADLKYKDSKGNTSLHICALINNPYYCELLIRRGASKEATNNENLTAFQLSEKIGEKSCLVTHFFKNGEILSSNNNNTRISRQTSIVHFPVSPSILKEQIFLQLHTLRENIMTLRSSVQNSSDTGVSLELTKKAHLVNVIMFPN